VSRASGAWQFAALESAKFDLSNRRVAIANS
jgi:hypothetical protein